MANPFLTIGAVAVGVVTAGIGILQVPGWIASAQDSKARADLSQIADAQGAALATTGSYADSLDELESGVVGGVATGVKVQLSAGSDATLYPGDDWGGITQSQSGTWFALCAGDSGATAYETEEDAKVACGVDGAGGGTVGPVSYAANQIAITLDTTAPGCTGPGLVFQAGGGGVTVDWGDGSSETIPSESAGSLHPHSYTDAGTYTAVITGQVPAYGAPVTYLVANQNRVIGANACLTSADHFGRSTGLASLDFAFFCTTNLETVATVPSGITSMNSTFQISTVRSGLSEWDVSEVTNMYNMFGNARQMNDDISAWDVSNVTDMRLMFFSAMSFNQDLSTWDVSSVTKMQDMFGSTPAMKADLSGWDVRNVTSHDGWRADSGMTTEPAWPVS